MNNVVELNPAPAMTAAEFKVLRERLGLTASWVATQLGVYEKTVSRWETGERAVSADAAEILDQVRAYTNRLVMQRLKKIPAGRLPGDVVVLYTYRLDADMPAMVANPECQPLPASWHRAMIGRIAALTDAEVKIAYADPEDDSVAPLNSG